MARLNKKNAVIAIAILAILGLVLSPIYFLLMFLPLYVVIPGAALFFSVLMYILLRTVVQIFLFPGAFRLWRRSIESHFCKEMSSQLLQRVQEIRTSIEILLNIASQEEKEDFIPASREVLLYAKRLISAIIENFALLKEEAVLTPHQETLYLLLQELQSSLSQTRLSVQQEPTQTMWEWFDHVACLSDWSEIIYEDFPQNGRGGEALSRCIELEKCLMNSCGEVPFKEKVKRWFYDTSFGTLSQMRLEFDIRYNVEQIWITVDDNVCLDCMYIPSLDATSDAPTMLICNPNAGYYEFAYYQNQWLESFLMSGMNVFLWNYRGYGRSKGIPSMNNIKRDGEVVVQYLRNNKNTRKLGVFGEGLGGCVACHLARSLQLDFLFVDRCFSTLENLAVHNFSRLAGLIIRCLHREKAEVTSDFLEADCYKVLSTDPQDGGIHDLASLKTGVALVGVNDTKLMNDEEFKSFLGSLECLMKLIVHQMNQDNDRPLIEITEFQEYLGGQGKMTPDQDLIDEDTVTNLLCKLFTIIDSLDAGGKPLSHVYMNSPRLFALEVWVVTLEVYGSYLPLLPDDVENSRMKTTKKLKESIEEMETVYKDYEIISNIFVSYILMHTKNLIRSLRVILSRYEKNWLDKSGALSIDDSHLELHTNSFSRYDPYKVGYLIPISSAQGQPERMQIEYHLTNSMFLD